MPFVSFVPISMKSLNYNIDDNLVFSGIWGKISRALDSGVLNIYGGNVGNGACISLSGWEAIGTTGTMLFYTPDNTGVLGIRMTIYGSLVVPYIDINAVLDMKTHQIKNVVDPTLAQDAATKNYCDTTLGLGTQGDLTVSTPVAISNATRHLIGGAAALSLINDAATTVTEIDTGALANVDTVVPTSKAVTTALATKATVTAWSPYTPVWTWNVAPGSPTASGRWTQIDKTVFWEAMYQSADSNGGYLQTVSLPKTSTGITTASSIAFIYNTNAYAALTAPGYISSGTPTVFTMATFPATIDGQFIGVYISGFYEVTT